MPASFDVLVCKPSAWTPALISASSKEYIILWRCTMFFPSNASDTTVTLSGHHRPRHGPQVVRRCKLNVIWKDYIKCKESTNFTARVQSGETVQYGPFLAHLKCVSAFGSPDGLPEWPACLCDSSSTFRSFGERFSVSFLRADHFGQMKRNTLQHTYHAL
eukprot:scaffold163264_cov39-Prasinocladus_malaysianus.AAC.1